MRRSLIIPVYLNQRIVFDLLAMLEGGISHVTRVASTEQTREVSERRYGAEFGLSKALAALLSINVSGKQERTEESKESSARDEERIHTPASLFFRLRNQLLAQGLMSIVDEGYEPAVHDLVEFTASLSRNPIIQTMDALISLGEMILLFSDDDAKDRSGGGKAHGKSKDVEKFRGREIRESQRILDQMKVFQENLKAGDTVDVVAEGIGGNYRAIITLETEYLNDPTMADLVDGRFNVVGKIMRVAGQGETISLLRKSALHIMPAPILNTMMAGFRQLSDNQGFNLPKLEWEIDGPAFQVIPIAIFA